MTTPPTIQGSPVRSQGASLAAGISVFVTVFLITVIVATAITFILPESYASTARIKVDNSLSTTNQYDPYFIQTEFEVIQSQLVLDAVIMNLNLNVQWGKKYFNGEVLKSTETLEILKGRLSLAPVRGTKLIAITVYGEERNEAAQIANAIAESYRDYRIKSSITPAAKAFAELQAQYQVQAEQIQKIQANLDLLRQVINITNEATAGHTPKEQPYWDTKAHLSQLLNQHDELSLKLKADKADQGNLQTALVQIMDRAEPGRYPVKPNKPLNIALGALFGIILGGAAAALVGFIKSRSPMK